MPTNNHRFHDPSLDLDFETAPDVARKPLGHRAYVGGVLYIEGIIVFIMGSMLLLSYWPPVSAHGEHPNPISQFGLWMTGGALIYMVVVGVGIFIYNMMHPSARIRSPQTEESGAVSRARRYASMRRKTYYIFDNTIRCAKDAEDANRARDLY